MLGTSSRRPASGIGFVGLLVPHPGRRTSHQTARFDLRNRPRIGAKDGGVGENTQPLRRSSDKTIMKQEDGKTGRFGDCSEAIIGACIEVHRHLGPGLLESAYEHCVAHELAILGLRFERQRPVPLEYKGTKLDCGYRLDLLVERSILLEIKCVDR